MIPQLTRGGCCMLKKTQSNHGVLFFRCDGFVMTFEDYTQLMDMSGVAWMFLYHASGSYQYVIFFSQDALKDEESVVAWRAKIEHWCYDRSVWLYDLIEGDKKILYKYLKNPISAIPKIALKLTPEEINNVALLLTQKGDD